ncbi:MAG: TSUP family transporter [Paraclostridium bifermentans]|uniref:sulfite exporter TauE/SafE family protein n=1 Tax=Paraclostridium bifermentans TaxID=1490 RepID=UPI0011DE0AB5|nr:TSUP family transporter [Paraclostridium bifermentans]MBS6507386.1 TSUP family transporter [Paraclostridium bifermentans]MDU3801670.1 TSUP family transporter [Paraclostridium bifermentans]
MLTILFLCLGGFLAAFVDSIAGGGGLISMPVLLMAGLPAHLALGTNKFAGAFGCFSSAYKYSKSGKSNIELLKKLIPFTILGCLLGVKCVLSISENILNILVFLMILIVALYTYLKKDLGKEDKFENLSKENIKKGIIMAFALGFYDGFFGPGTGTFLTFAFIKIYGFDFLHASANTKILNFTSNFTALILFMFSGQILYKIAIFYAISMVLGGYIGAKVAINKGSQLIKPIFLFMAVAVAIKLLYQAF